MQSCKLLSEMTHHSDNIDGERFHTNDEGDR